MKQFAVVSERGTRGYEAFVPGLPGGVATGRTHDLAGRRIREAIGLRLTATLKALPPVPAPNSWTGAVGV